MRPRRNSWPNIPNKNKKPPVTSEVPKDLESEYGAPENPEDHFPIDHEYNFFTNHVLHISTLLQLMQDASEKKRTDLIERLAVSDIAINTSNVVLDAEMKNLLNRIDLAKEKKITEKLLPMQTYSTRLNWPDRKNFDASDFDISHAKITDYKNFHTMHFSNTKVSRQQFFYLMKCGLLATTLCESLDVSEISIACFDLSAIELQNIKKLKFSKTQNFTGCILTPQQANYLVEQGLAIVDVKIIEDDRFTTFASPILKKDFKIAINARQLESLVCFRNNPEFTLDDYQITLPELEKILKRLRAGDTQIHKFPNEYKNALKKLIPFLQLQAKNYGIKKIVLSRFKIKDIDFSKIDLNHIEFKECVFEEVAFNQTHCEHAQFHDCAFKNCNFNNIRISDHTVFKDCKFNFLKKNEIHTVIYQQGNVEKKIDPLKFFTDIQKQHEKLLEDKKKSVFFHGFFNKTAKGLNESMKRGSLSHLSQCGFLGMLKVNKQASENKKGITAEARRVYLNPTG